MSTQLATGQIADLIAEIPIPRTVSNHEYSARERRPNQLKSVRLFWNYDPAALRQKPRDEIYDLDDAELADAQDLVD